MVQYKAVIFDIDDTLYDRQKAQVEIIKLIRGELEEFFMGIDEETLTEAFLKSDDLAMEKFGEDTPAHIFRMGRNRFFLNLIGLDEDYSEEITEMYVRLYPQVNAPSDGVITLVNELAKRFLLGVLSNGHSDVQYGKLETLGIKDLFNSIVISSEVQLWKPDPAIFTLTCDDLGVKSEESLYVGNSYENDVVGAKSAGLGACWYNPDGQYPSSAEIIPDFEINNLKELLNILV